MVTIRDIARVSGKSYSTVSRSLNGNPHINVDTRTAIQTLAVQMGYRPSFAGKALKRGCTHMIAMLVPDLGDPFYAEFIHGVRTLARRDGYDVALFDYGLSPKQEVRCLEMMLTGFCDGAIAFITSFEHTRKVVEQFWSGRLPLLAVGTPDCERLPCDLLSEDLPSGLSEVFQFLRRRGKRHLAIIQEAMAADTLSRVHKDLMRRWADSGMDFDPSRDLYVVSDGGHSQAEDGYQLACKIFRERPETDVILAWHGVQAYGVQRAAVEFGRRIPEDVMVVACDRTWITRMAPFPLIALDQRLDVLAAEAWRLVGDRLRQSDWQAPVRRNVQAVAEYGSLLSLGRNPPK